MTNRTMRLPVLALAAMATACSGGGLADVLGGVLGGGTGGQPQTGTLTVEVREVRQQEQQILVATEDGKTGVVLYDANTQVVYNNENYPVRALEYGDIVDMRVQEVQQGLYTDLIQVRQSVQERQGGTRSSPAPDVYRVEGTIGQIDLSRNMFTLNMTQGGTVPVHLPSDATSAMRERLREYRGGDYVRVEIQAVDQQSAVLVRWGWS